MSAEEITAPTPVPDGRDELPIGKPQPQLKPGSHVTSGSRSHRSVRRCPRRPVQTARPEPQPEPEPEPEPPEAAAERERRYREIFGLDEPRPRRRWRR